MNITLVPKNNLATSILNGLTTSSGLTGGDYTVGSINTSYDPFSVMDNWTSKWPGLFSTFDAVTSSYGGYSNPWKVNKNNENLYEIELEMPRFKKENINISVENEVLHVNAEQDSLKFYHSVSLYKEIDPESINAKLDHGVLYITANKAESAKPKKITIKTA
jgi:HSP20 family protein